jgi:hypothetical protein
MEDEKTYSVFKIFQNIEGVLYVTDDLDCGITLKLEPVHTETEELLTILDSSPKKEPVNVLCNIKVYEVKKYLPSIVSLERITRLPNEILFKDYTDLTNKE